VHQWQTSRNGTWHVIGRFASRHTNPPVSRRFTWSATKPSAAVMSPGTLNTGRSECCADGGLCSRAQKPANRWQVDPELGVTLLNCVRAHLRQPHFDGEENGRLAPDDTAGAP
jgi:hypothetical protein